MNYNIGHSFAEMFIRVMNLVYIVRILAEGQIWMLK